MAVSDEALRQAAEAIAAADGLAMDPEHLVEDTFLLAYAFEDESEFKAAVANTCRAIAFLVSGQVTPSSLKYEFEDWHSYHYQHRIGQGEKADCRIIFRPTDEGIEVKGFGHRRIPEDLYRRLSKGRKSAK